MIEFIMYINEMVEQFRDEEKNLILTDRKDEANLVKIKINICEICKTLYNVASKNSGEARIKEEYLKQLTRLPKNWKISYEKAKEHHDVEKMVIEEIKLEVLSNIKKKFEECM